MTNLELKLPEEIMDTFLGRTKNEIITYLSTYFDDVIDKYSERFQKRVSGVMGSPLSKYERSMLKDLLMDLAIGKVISDDNKEKAGL